MCIVLFIFSTCLTSCKKNGRRDSIAKIVKEWTGREIHFPEELACTFMGKDTTCIDLHNDNYKILLYVDSIGCTSCRQNLFDWRKIMNESDSAFIRKPDFIFIFQPKKDGEEELYSILKSNGFRHPVFIDKEDQFNRINKFPSNPEHQSFLLDRHNKVVMVGNPSLMKGIWLLYKKVIIESETSVLTMEKGGEFTSLTGTTTLPPRVPQSRKETANVLN